MRISHGCTSLGTFCRYRDRDVAVEAQFGGDGCQGFGQEDAPCEVVACPIDCQVRLDTRRYSFERIEMRGWGNGDSIRSENLIPSHLII